jgi:hypothetical protein
MSLFSQKLTSQMAFSHTALILLGVVLALAAWSLRVAEASAEGPIHLCVPETAGKTVTSDGIKTTCAKEERAVELPDTAELATLKNILPHISYEVKGVGGKPTIQVKSVNVQIVSGSGTLNGEGNLIIGDDQVAGTQTGSENLVLGSDQSFTSYGGLLAGSGNTVSGPDASVTGGRENTASGELSSISGGVLNTAKNTGASVSGGSENIAENNGASISGGADNRAEANGSSISGGFGNVTKQPGNWASILGGDEHSVSTEYGLYP